MWFLCLSVLRIQCVYSVSAHAALHDLCGLRTVVCTVNISVRRSSSCFVRYSRLLYLSYLSHLLISCHNDLSLYSTVQWARGLHTFCLIPPFFLMLSLDPRTTPPTVSAFTLSVDAGNSIIILCSFTQKNARKCMKPSNLWNEILQSLGRNFMIRLPHWQILA